MSRALLVGVAAIVSFAVGAPVHAEQAPHPGGYDQHVELVAYNPLNVVRITGTPTNST
ncbi:hypothetical protein [Candidatus Burkholderia verschuerenii]|uniref:hypothetical protein n=1 Tax=Candidatus Burkholderia verschuerenii TaxID=242163 RepID=UPI000B2633DF|nr:hypothetical protein [Candidatus Burkholderia verschuerenii]